MSKLISGLSPNVKVPAHGFESFPCQSFPVAGSRKVKGPQMMDLMKSHRLTRSVQKAGDDHPGLYHPVHPTRLLLARVYTRLNTPAPHCEGETAKAGPVSTRRDQRLAHDKGASVNGWRKRRADFKAHQLSRPCFKVGDQNGWQGFRLQKDRCVD